MEVMGDLFDEETNTDRDRLVVAACKTQSRMANLVDQYS